MRTLKSKIVAAIVLASIIALTGCSSWEQQTYRSLAVSRAVILEAKHQADAGNIAKTPANVALINDAMRIHNDAVFAFRAYIEAQVALNSAKANESARPAGQTSIINEVASAQATLQLKIDGVNKALADVARVVADVSALVKKK